MKVGSGEQHGAALMVMVVLLLQMSLLTLLMLHNHQQQLTALATLDEKALQRSLGARQLFDQLAQQIIDSPPGNMQEGVQQMLLNAKYDFGDVSLQYQVQPVTCQHLPPEQAMTTSCWSLEIREPGSGFFRQRQLHVADNDCGAYWYMAEAGS